MNDKCLHELVKRRKIPPLKLPNDDVCVLGKQTRVKKERSEERSKGRHL